MKNWIIPASCSILALLSLLILRSVAPSLATQQLIFFLLGAVVLTVTAHLPYRLLASYHWLGYLALCVLLLIPLAIDKTTRGIAGWIDIGTLFSIQPSQLAIPLAGLSLAELLAHQDILKIKWFITALALVAVPAVLILAEPDLGTTLVYLASLGSMILVSPSKNWHLGAVAAGGVIVVILAWLFVLAPYQKARITSFMSRDSDPQGASYNARQSLIAVGSGQFLGRGLGQGVQSHLRFLPERQTDFIFASLAEELGFVGGGLVIGIYTTLVLTSIWGFYHTSDVSAKYFCMAIGMMLAVQAGINMGMNMGMFPITGITLPLLSYGGSSILAISLMLGIVWSILREVRFKAILNIT